MSLKFNEATTPELGKEYRCTLCHHMFKVPYGGHHGRQLPCPRCGALASRTYQEVSPWSRLVVSSGWGKGGPKGKRRY